LTNYSPIEKEESPIRLGTGDLTIEQVVRVARFQCQVLEVGPASSETASQVVYERVIASRSWVEDVISENEKKEARGDQPLSAYYGINTGFGSKAGRKGLGKDDIPWVTRNLIISHSSGVGDLLHPEVVRAAMLIRANSLAQGYSGVRPELINIFVRMLNRGVIPLIPEYGSVGASGDLAPLSHLTQVLSKRPEHGGMLLNDLPDDYDEGGKAYLTLTDQDNREKFSTIVEIDGVRYAVLSGHTAMRTRELEPLELSAKEGLACNNGTTFSAALAALALYDAENITRHAEIAAALSLEALLGFRDAFFPQIQAIRHQVGQVGTADRILAFIKGSTLVDGNVDSDPRYIPPQDAYSLRVTPQVTGAVWDTLVFIRQTLTREINAATDNPSIFLELPRSYKAVSGGNFHGAPVAYAMDFLSIVMTDLGSLSERRTFRLTDPTLNLDLPGYLVKDVEGKSGRTSGLMITQYLAADLVSDCKTLAHPDSVDSIPTSGNQEDHVSMSMNAARHARKIVQNIGYVIAIELLCSYVALTWRINDMRNKLDGSGYRNEDERPENKADIERTRVELLVMELVLSKQTPKAGEGCMEALETITGTLYPKQNALPEIGVQPSTEDRFLQPYLFRMAKLVNRAELVDRVYRKTGITH
jgi:histidine ammonia-lyase